MMALWKRPVDQGEIRWAATETPPADSPKSVTYKIKVKNILGCKQTFCEFYT